MQSLRITLASPVDPRHARTNAVADVRLCSALARLGHDVRWLVPAMGSRRVLEPERILDSFSPPTRFDVQVVSTLRREGPLKAGRLTPMLLAERFLTRETTHLLSRDLRLLALAAVAGPQRPPAVVPWLHEYRDEPWERWICRRCNAVLATNSAIVTALRKAAPDMDALVIGNPIWEERAQFAATTSRDEARRQLDLAPAGPLVVYTGKLHPHLRELAHLLYAAEQLPAWQFLFTGGQPDAVRAITHEIGRRGLTNLTLTGFLPASEDTRLYQQAADVLVSYYSAHDHKFAEHNLPNKLDEYFATGNPVVIADLPAVRDVASDDTAYLVPPDEPHDLVDALRQVIADPSRAAVVGRRARDAAQGRTYERTAARIANFLRSTGLTPHSRRAA